MPKVLAFALKEVDFWEKSITYMFWIAHNRSVGDVRTLDLEFEWDLMCSMVTIIFHDVMRLRYKLRVLDPASSDLRFHILKIGDFFVTEAKRRDHKDLYVLVGPLLTSAYAPFRMHQLSISRLQDLNILMWAAEPLGSELRENLDPIDYFAVYEALESLRTQMLQIQKIKVQDPIFQGEPSETIISCCQSLLRRGKNSDKEAQAIVAPTSRLAVVSPLAFAQAGIHRDLVDMLWTRLKTSPGGLSIFKLSAASISYFAYVTGPSNPLLS